MGVKDPGTCRRSGRLDPEAREEVGEDGDVEPGSGALRRALVAGRQPPPAAQAREGLLDAVERRDREEADGALRRCLDVKPDTPLLAAILSRPR